MDKTLNKPLNPTVRDTVSGTVAAPSVGAPRPCRPTRKRRRAPRGKAAGRRGPALERRQLLFQLTRQLVEAQFVRADQPRCERLWQQAADLDLDPERIIHLLYGVADHADSAEMEAVDRLMGTESGAWRQSAPPAGTPTHR